MTTLKISKTLRKAFQLYSTNGGDDIDWKNPTYPKSVKSWAVSDAGKNESKEGIYFAVEFTDTEHINQKLYLGFNFTYKQLKNMLATVEETFPEVKEDATES